jgi:hypothetical protein
MTDKPKGPPGEGQSTRKYDPGCDMHPNKRMTTSDRTQKGSSSKGR